MPAPAILASHLPLSRLLDLAATHNSPALAYLAHARAFVLGLHRDSFLSSNLVSSYSRLDLPSFARLAFDSSPHLHTTLLLWNSVLAAYLRAALFREPLALFSRLRFSVAPDNYTLAILSKAAAELRDLRTGKTIHSAVVKFGFGSDAVLLNSLINLYLKCGCMVHARSLFDEMHMRSVASWNTLISEYANSGDFFSQEEIWNLVIRMQEEGMKPDAFTVSAVLPLCDAEFGREIHGFVVRHNLVSDFHVGSCLISMYSRNNKVSLGRWIFDRMVCKNVVVWTAMISGYVENGDFEEGLMLFRMMQLRYGTAPNKITLVSVLPAIGALASFTVGKQIHGFAIRVHLNDEVSLNNALIDMYSKCGSLTYARLVFDDGFWHKDVISWSSMVLCYAIHGKGREAILLFDQMCGLGIKIDQVTSVGVLSACAKAGLVTEGIKIYNSLVKDHRVSPTVEMCSCMVDMLGRSGQLNEALNFINLMSLPPSPSIWGALFDASMIHSDQGMQDLAYRSLLQLEPENPSNYVSLSNIHAFNGRWYSVAEVRTRMKERGLRKMPGYSWINVDSKVHSFYVADKSHHCSDMIYASLDNLLLAMRGLGCGPDPDYLSYSSIS